MNKEKLVVIIGPTAVGKTKLSIELAKRFNGEIISGDSMQIYRSMDIGTAKITAEEMDGIPHHLINIKEPTEPYSAAEFQTDVRKLIKDINERNKLPIIVGGTGLYIQSVIQDYHFSDQGKDLTVRDQLEKEAQEYGIDVLVDRLKMVDPVASEKIHPNNHRRIIRALEIYITTGKTMSDYIDDQDEETLYDVALIGLTLDRELLYDRINKRVDVMIEQGLEQEVKRLYQQGIKDVQSIQAIGYKELYQYLDGLITFAEAVELLKRNSRRYAKRQLTWFRNKMDVHWFDMTNEEYEKKFTEIIHYIAGKLEI
ncbi:tRNA (adenosine(37)-N6)-dimethylallyltransferase MiaA [Bacillus sp. AK128]